MVTGERWRAGAASVEHVGVEELTTGMGMPADLHAPLVTVTTAAAFHYVAARDESEMVVTACVFAHEDTAEAFGAATLPAHRG